MATNAAAVTGDTLITIKLAIEGSNRKFQLPLKDLNDPVFSEKVRSSLTVIRPCNVEPSGEWPSFIVGPAC